MSTNSRFEVSIGGLFLLALLLVAVIVLSNSLFRGWRVDLTQDGLYTMSQGSRNIASSIDEPINFYYFFSDKATSDFPSIRLYATRVKELLQEFAERSGGKIKLQIIDPLPFSEDEDRASQFGLQPVSLGAGSDPIYFGAAATNSVGDQEIVAFFDPARENFLEYDVAKLINKLADPVRPVLGLMTGLPMSGGFDPQSQQMTPGWVIYQQLQQLYEVKSLGLSIDKVPDDIELLLVVHPKGISDQTNYALDQFILGGGKAILFVDPHAEIDMPPTDPNNPQAAMFADRSSNLDQLLGAWGLETKQVVLDNVNALQVGAGTRHLGIIGIPANGMTPDNVIVGDLDSINFAFAGAIMQEEESSVDLQPLVSSSEQSSAVPAETVKFTPNPDMLRNSFKPGGTSLSLVAKVSGKPNSAFPDGAPSTPSDEGEEAQTVTSSDHIGVAENDINVILVADVDVLTDRLWASVQQFFGQRLVRPFANNSDFVTNAVDNFSGSSDLIGIRGRAGFSRPFKRVDALRREADEKFRQTEQGLQQELQEMEKKLSELQANREDKSALILTDEQSLELQRFQEERVRIRKELRQVRRDLDKDIESLGMGLKIINSALMPVLIAMFGVYMFLRRRRLRRGTV